MPTTKKRPPIKRLIFVALVLLIVSALWIQSSRASMYTLQPTPGHHVVYYVESSSGCIMLLLLWDMRGMGALPLEAELHGPITPVYRWAFFGHEEGERLSPFRVFTSIQSSSSAFGFTLPHWLFIVITLGCGGLTLRRWRWNDPGATQPCVR
jgi:hypothetical protein